MIVYKTAAGNGNVAKCKIDFERPLKNVRSIKPDAIESKIQVKTIPLIRITELSMYRFPFLRDIFGNENFFTLLTFFTLNSSLNRLISKGANTRRMLAP